MVVLAGDGGDFRLLHAVDLLRRGYAKELVIDETSYVKYGQPMYAYAQQYVDRLAPELRAHVHVCPFEGNATQLELREIAPCLRAASPGATSALLVTSAFHTRRALSVAEHVLPQYGWTVSATAEPSFGVDWWKNREWAKTCLTEWQKMVWWHLVGKWRA